MLPSPSKGAFSKEQASRRAASSRQLPRAMTLASIEFIKRPGLASFVYPRVDPDGVFAARPPVKNRSGLRFETVIRILRTKSRLYRVPMNGDFLLLQRQRFAGSHAQLPFHEIEARNRFGNWVLDLKAGVHFQKVYIKIGIGDKLDRSRIHIANGACCLDRVTRQLFTLSRGQNRARRLLNNFLPPSLYRAIALIKMHDVAPSVAENLHLDMTGPLD